MTNIFPETLAPNFFHVDKLPEYGLQLTENELGREIRRYTEDTGYKTELKVQYNGLRSDEVKVLTAFYLQVKGTFDKFTLPTNFYRSPSSITNSLNALGDTTEWRFMNPPTIQTVVSDIYTVEIKLLSLKESLNPDDSKIIGFVSSVNVNFILPTILIEKTQVRELVPIALQFIASSISVNKRVTANSIALQFNTPSFRVKKSVSAISIALQFSTPLIGVTKRITADSIALQFTTPSINRIRIRTPDSIALQISTPQISLNERETSNSIDLQFSLPLSVRVNRSLIADSIDLQFSTPSISVTRRVTPDSTAFTLNVPNTILTSVSPGTTSSRSIQSLSLSFVTAQTGFARIQSFEQMPSIVVSGTFTSLPRYIHLVSTALGVATTTLPSDAPDDTVIIYSDFAGTSSTSPTGFGLNAFTLNAPAGQTIQGQTSRVLNVENTSIQVVKRGTRWTIVGTELATVSGGGGGGASSGLIPLEQMQGSSVTQLNFSSNQDTNDLFFFLGTNENTTSWSNPTTNGRVTAVSSTGVGSGGVNTLTNRVYNSSENTGGAATRTVVYDLGTASFKSTSINILCQRNFGDSQTVTLEFSNDNTNWTTVTSGTPVGGNLDLTWTRVTYPMTVVARYWRVTLQLNGSVSFYAWSEVMLYGEWVGATVNNVPLLSTWQGKLAYNDLYNNNFNLTIPDTTSNFPAGWFCYVRDDTANGIITITPQNSNVTLTAPNGLTLTKDDLYLLIHNGNKSWFVQKLTNIINSAGTGVAINSSKVISNSLTADSIGSQIESPSNKTYTLVNVAKFGFTIENISISTGSGTCTAAIQINGVNVGGLSSISVTTTNQNINSTTAKTVAAGGRLTLVITSNNNSADLIFTIGIIRT